MLPYILALVVAVGSLALYLSAFFFPETHRKGDIVFSGVGLFYALVLWVCANRFTGAALLGQTASVALLTWFGWQTLVLRRELVPSDRRTGWGPKTLQQGLGRLIGGLMKLPGDLVGAFSRPKPTPVAPPTSVPAEPTTLTEMPTGSDEASVTLEVAGEADAAVTVEPSIAPAPATPTVPTTIADTPATVPSPEVIEPEAPVTGEIEEPAAPPPIAQGLAQEITPELELPKTEDLIEVETPETEADEEADTWEVEETSDRWEEEDQSAVDRPPPAPAKPKRENIFTVLKDTLAALSPFKKRPSRPMITLNRSEAGDETAAPPDTEPEVGSEIAPEVETEIDAEIEAEVETETEVEELEPVAETEITAEVIPDVEASRASEGEAIATVEQDQSEVDDWEAEASPAVANTTDALAEEDSVDTTEAISNKADVARLEVPEELETSGETDLGPDGAAAVDVSADVEVAQSDLDVIDEPMPEAAIEIEASTVSETEAEPAEAVISDPETDLDKPTHQD